MGVSITRREFQEMSHWAHFSLSSDFVLSSFAGKIISHARINVAAELIEVVVVGVVTFGGVSIKNR